MKKILKTIIVAMVITMLAVVPCFAAETVTADSVQKKMDNLKNTSAIITKPEDKTYITTNNKVAISGKGQEHDKVTISTYTKSGSEYKLIDEKTIEIGALGVFTTTVNLSYVESAASGVKTSADTYVYVRITRDGKLVEDARIIKYTSEQMLRSSISSLKL